MNVGTIDIGRNRGELYKAGGKFVNKLEASDA